VCSLTEQRAQRAEERALAAEASVVDALEKLRAAERRLGVRDDDSASITREPCTTMSLSSAVTDHVSGVTTTPTAATPDTTLRRLAKSGRKKK